MKESLNEAGDGHSDLVLEKLRLERHPTAGHLPNVLIEVASCGASGHQHQAQVQQTQHHQHSTHYIQNMNNLELSADGGI